MTQGTMGAGMAVNKPTGQLAVDEPDSDRRPPLTDNSTNATLISNLASNALSLSFWANKAVYVAFVGLIIVGGLTSGVFLTPANIEGIGLAASVLVVVTIGQALVLTAGGIDLSIPSTIQLAAAVIGVGVTHSWPLGLEIPIVLCSGIAVGLVNGLLITKVRLSDFIVTLATYGAVGGIALLLSDSNSVTITDRILLGIALNGIGPISYMVIIAAAAVVIGHYTLFHTRFGMHLTAVGGNRPASGYLGVNVARVRIGVYVISGLLAAIGGIMVSSMLGSADPTAGSQYLLGTVASAVLGGVSLLGGRGTIIGATIGALVWTAIVNILTLLGIEPFWQPIATGVVLVLALYLRRYERE
jgi:ribose/xylose/arabinose/galactoside ABC-type transport system permease subunit